MVSAQQMRDAERPHLEAGVDLMAVASRAVAHEAGLMLGEAGRSGPVLVAVGPGNNGGDGLFAAAHLAAKHAVAIWLTAGRGHEAGLAAARAAGCVVLEADAAMAEVGSAALVIDAVLGIGARPGLEGDVAAFAAACGRAGVPVLAVDLPSGLDPDSIGEHTSFDADVTVTFGALKLCHVATPAAARCGRTVLADLPIAIPQHIAVLAEPADLRRDWPFPSHTSDKYSRGVVGLDTGSATYPGAALLGCDGAVHSGAGMVRYLGGAPKEMVLVRHPSVVISGRDERVQALVIGSGWGHSPETLARVDASARRGVPHVVDADALGAVGEVDLPDGSLLTPHAGELARMLEVDRSRVERDPIGSVTSAARRFSTTVLLKGATQYVATPDGHLYIAHRGPAWTAQAGSGDVLAGVCGVLLAAGLPAWQAGVLGASLQALAAEAFPGPHPPDALAAKFPHVLAGLTRR